VASAGGSASDGRDRKTQAIYSLRGKILNTHNKSLDVILDSEEIKNIVSALGTGIGPNFDIEKLRYHKVCTLTDSDVDGSHICVLLLTLFFKHMRPLIEGGFIYVANAPLYIIKKGARKLGFLKNEAERDQWILDKVGEEYDLDPKTTLKDLDKELVREVIGNYSFGYLKGLGEMNPEELALTTLNPKYRNLERVTIEDAEAAEYVFRVLMDSKATVVPERKEFIIDNALEASIDI